MKVLALDISSCTGWAVLVGEKDPTKKELPTLEEYGTLELTQRIKTYAEGEYPWAIRLAAMEMGEKMGVLIDNVEPDVVVVECVNKARARMSQQALDWFHYELVTYLAEAGNDLFYVDSSEWRKVTGSVMDKGSKKANAKLSAAKRKAAAKGTKLDRKALGIKGKVTKKHVAIARANELFSLSLKVKDNDKADAILEGLSFFWGANPTELE